MMIINNNKNLIDDFEEKFEDPNYIAWWEGLFFINGILSGKDSMKYFFQIIKKKDIARYCNEICGNYSCLIYEKKTKKYYFFSDNYRGTPVFYNKNLASSSFLKLIKLIKKDDLEFNNESIIDFIISGSVYTDKVFFNNINILKYSEILVFENNEFSVISKQFENIYEKNISQADFFNNFKKMSLSLKNRKINIELSGGIDSRLLTCIFNKTDLHFETSVCGQEGHFEIDISREVAKELNVSHYITYHRYNDNDIFNELKNVFISNDGLTDVVDNHRMHFYNKDRKDRGNDISISASAGELYKDGGWWRSAFKTIFSFNWKKKLVKNLVLPGLATWKADTKMPVHLFSKNYKEICENYQERLIKIFLAEFSYNKRFKMADRIFLEFSVSSPRALANGFLKRYSPLQERCIMPFGINLPLYKRFMAYFYRKTITGINKKVSKIRTSKASTSINSNPFTIIIDFIKIFIHVIRIKFFGLKEMELSNKDIYNVCRNNIMLNKYIDKLKEIGFFDKSLELENINNRYIGRIINLGFLFDYIGL